MLWGESNETVIHISRECIQLTRKEYKLQDTWIGKKTHWEVYTKFGFNVEEKCQEYQPEEGVENDRHKIWNFSVQCIMSLKHVDPSLGFTNKASSNCQIIDLAISCDIRVDSN